MTNDHITQTLAIRDYVLFRLASGRTINANTLAMAFGLSSRQGRRYLTAINAHYRLGMIWDSSRKTFRLEGRHRAAALVERQPDPAPPGMGEVVENLLRLEGDAWVVTTTDGRSEPFSIVDGNSYEAFCQALLALAAHGHRIDPGNAQYLHCKLSIAADNKRARRLEYGRAYSHYQQTGDMGALNEYYKKYRPDKKLHGVAAANPDLKRARQAEYSARWRRDNPEKCRENNQRAMERQRQRRVVREKPSPEFKRLRLREYNRAYSAYRRNGDKTKLAEWRRKWGTPPGGNKRRS